MNGNRGQIRGTENILFFFPNFTVLRTNSAGKCEKFKSGDVTGASFSDVDSIPGSYDVGCILPTIGFGGGTESHCAEELWGLTVNPALTLHPWVKKMCLSVESAMTNSSIV